MMNFQTFSDLKMPVKVHDGILFIKPHEAIHVVANEKHCQVYILDNPKPIYCCWSISEIKENLPSHFFMCHLSHIINLQHLEKLEKDNRTIHLSDGHIVTMSDTYINDFMIRMHIRLP
jgi:DNA-binding LytR/AlgR family response regulator